MRGSNITNKYIIDSREYLFSELTKDQLAYVESIADKTKYNNIRNQLLEEEGDEVKCTIKINVVDQEMTAFDEFDVFLFKS
jgi:spore cortex formation protein SpoVR/YcgB (stage V sporulation)